MRFNSPHTRLFLLLRITLSAIVMPVFGQPVIEWQRCSGGSDADVATDIQITKDGGAIVVGYSFSDNGDVSTNQGGSDFWVVKLDDNGMVSWERTYGGSALDLAFSVVQTPDGGFAVAGYTTSNDGDVTGVKGLKDFWLIRLDSLGALLWQRTYGGSDYDEAWAVDNTNDGGLILTGRTGSIDGDVSGLHNSFDFWVLKVDNKGNIEWQKVLGGSQTDIAYIVKTSKDGSYIVAGESSSNDGDAVGQHGNGDFWVVKLSAEGSIIWQKMLGGFGDDRANDICLTSDGGYILTGLGATNGGDITGNHGGYDVWVTKIDSLGQLQWQKSLGGIDQDYGQSVQQTEDGGYVVTGGVRSNNGDVIGNHGSEDFWVVKLTSQGSIQWQKTLGGSKADFAYCIQQADDLGFVVAGFTQSNNTGDVSGFHGVQDFWIVKLSPETVSTQAPSVQPLEIFPNPAEQQITLNAPTLGRLQVRLTDLLGRQLLAQTLVPNEAMDVSALQPAVYHLSATDEDGRVFAGKLLIK